MLTRAPSKLIHERDRVTERERKKKELMEREHKWDFYLSPKLMCHTRQQSGFLTQFDSSLSSLLSSVVMSIHRKKNVI